MITYETIEANDWLKDFQKKLGVSEYSILKGKDEKEYQVKFNQSNSREFIAHYIATRIGVPVPEAKIIYISDYIMDDIVTTNTNVNPFNSKHYFGIEWKGNTIEWADYDELLGELNNVSNYTQFLSIFPFDQYLRNYDRHEFNHMILMEKNQKLFYNSIDADRIFFGYEYKDILNELGNYNCVYPEYNGKVLYSVIKEEDFDTILKYSNVISILDEDEIDDIVDICYQLYGIEKNERDNIKKFLLERKEKIYDSCMSNTDCYKNVMRRLHAN